MKNNLLITIIIVTTITGCRTHKSQIVNVETTQPKKEESQTSAREYSIQAVLWQQHAAEYRALAYQAFNLAKIQLDNILANAEDHEKPLAIVTDIDETVLNNSPFNGKLIELDEEYSKSRWIDWGLEKKAKAIPSSLDFFKYAKGRGVEIFYISNRLSIQITETLENLEQLEFPFADVDHIILKTNTSGKELRRLSVKKTHEIIMLLGDNLSDFTEVFDDKSTSERNHKVDSLRTFFGKQFIILPNPMYGEWETKGIYEGKYDWSNFQKDSIRNRKIKGY